MNNAAWYINLQTFFWNYGFRTKLNTHTTQWEFSKCDSVDINYECTESLCALLTFKKKIGDLYTFNCSLVLKLLIFLL